MTAKDMIKQSIKELAIMVLIVGTIVLMVIACVRVHRNREEQKLVNQANEIVRDIWLRGRYHVSPFIGEHSEGDLDEILPEVLDMMEVWKEKGLFEGLMEFDHEASQKYIAHIKTMCPYDAEKGTEEWGIFCDFIGSRYSGEKEILQQNLKLLIEGGNQSVLEIYPPEASDALDCLDHIIIAADSELNLISDLPYSYIKKKLRNMGFYYMGSEYKPNRVKKL